MSNEKRLGRCEDCGRATDARLMLCGDCIVARQEEFRKYRENKEKRSLADCAVVWRPGWPVMNRESVEKVGVQE